METERKLTIEDIKNASPLEITNVLREYELYDMKSSQEIIDEVYKEFASGENIKESIVKPVFFSVMDGFLEGTSIGRKARKKGLTASRFIQECDNFSYNTEVPITSVDGYTEFKNMEEYFVVNDKEAMSKFDRNKIEDKTTMKKYKDNKIAENGLSKNLTDEYTGKKNITAYRNNPDNRRNDSKSDYQAETDHIVPLKQIDKQFKGNYALSEEDIKRIANQDYNLALTSGEINGKKKDMSNSDFIKKQEELEKAGREYINLDKETQDRMLKAQKQSQKAIEKEANITVAKKLFGKGEADSQSAINKQKEILEKTAKNATDQAKNYAIGNLILYIIKPIYYEISDIIKNGMKKGVRASSTTEALEIRFGRVKNYIISNVASFLGNNFIDFIKGIISSLIEGIISLFVGIFKQVLKVLKEGVKIFIQSAKVLFGKDSKKLSPAQKGDAIIKIIGGSVMVIAGVGIEFILNKIGMSEPWSVILSTMLSGIASALFMYLLDKADLFSVKAERRRDRIIEIFTERINDIEKAEKEYDVATIQALQNQRTHFEEIRAQINKGINSNDIDKINSNLYKMADFMNVDLGYSNTDEFCDFMDSKDAFCL